MLHADFTLVCCRPIQPTPTTGREMAKAKGGHCTCPGECRGPDCVTAHGSCGTVLHGFDPDRCPTCTCHCHGEESEGGGARTGALAAGPPPPATTAVIPPPSPPPLAWDPATRCEA